MDKSNVFNPENTVDAIWCVDSESGHRYLLDIKTGQVISTEGCTQCQVKI